MSLDFKNIQTKQFVDIPSSEPKIKAVIQKVGISNRPTNLKLKNPINGIATFMHSQLKVGCSLSADRRGIHMSRIEECMDELKEAGLSPDEYVKQLAAMVLKTQEQDDCYIQLESQVENRVLKNKSGKPSTEIIKLHAEIQVHSGFEKIKNGVTVPFMNACPCTQRWAMRDFYNLLTEQGVSEQQKEDLVKKAPLQAHTNGGEAGLFVYDNSVNHAAIYSVLDNSLPIIREMLKGMDEHAFVKMTHQQGQFCEDNIRAIAAEAVKQFEDKISGSTKLKIKVEVNESVHFHNLWAEIKKTYHELKSDFSQP